MAQLRHQPALPTGWASWVPWWSSYLQRDPAPCLVSVLTGDQAWATSLGCSDGSLCGFCPFHNLQVLLSHFFSEWLDPSHQPSFKWRVSCAGFILWAHTISLTSHPPTHYSRYHQRDLREQIDSLIKEKNISWMIPSFTEVSGAFHSQRSKSNKSTNICSLTIYAALLILHSLFWRTPKNF